MYKIIFSLFFLTLLSCSNTSKLVIPPNKVLNEKQKSEIEKNFIEFKRVMLYEKTDEALSILDKIFFIDSLNSVAFYEKSKIYFQKKQYDDALNSIRCALESNPSEKNYRLFEITVLKSIKDNEAISNALLKLLEDYPDQEEYWYESLDFFLSSNQYELSFDLLEKYENKFGYKDAILVNKFKLYLQLGKDSKLEKMLNNYRTKYPNNTVILQLFGDFYLHKKDINKAVEYYNKVISLDPDNFEALLALADYYQQTGDLKQSFSCVEKVINLQQVEVENKITVLLRFIEISKQDPQFNFYLKSITLNLKQQYPDNPDVQLLYGNVLASEESYKEAQGEFESSLATRVENLQGWIQLIIIDNELKDYDKIISHSTSAIEYYPNQLELYYYRGLAYFLKNEFKVSLKDFTFGNKITGKNDPLKYSFLYFIGETNYKLKNYNEAFLYFDKALEINPSEASLLNNYAYYLSVLDKNLDKAKEMSLKTVKQEPQNSTFLDTYAWILFNLDDFDQAIIYIEKAVLNGGSSSSVVMEHYGDILYKVGRVDEALTVWKEALVLPNPTKSLKIKNETKTYIE